MPARCARAHVMLQLISTAFVALSCSCGDFSTGGIECFRDDECASGWVCEARTCVAQDDAATVDGGDVAAHDVGGSDANDASADSDAALDVGADTASDAEPLDVSADARLDADAANCSEPDETHVDAVYRVTDLSIGAPGSWAAFTQSLMQADISGGRLHVLLDLRDFAVECGPTTLRIAAGAGRYDDNERAYTWEDSVPVPDHAVAAIDGTGRVVSEVPATIAVPMLDPGTGRLMVLPVADARFDGVVEQGEVALSAEVELSGALLREQVASISYRLTPEGPPRSLVELLGEDQMDYPLDAEQKLGWTVQMTWLLGRVAVAREHPDSE